MIMTTQLKLVDVHTRLPNLCTPPRGGFSHVDPAFAVNNKTPSTRVETIGLTFSKNYLFHPIIGLPLSICFCLPPRVLACLCSLSPLLCLQSVCWNLSLSLRLCLSQALSTDEGTGQDSLPGHNWPAAPEDETPSAAQAAIMNDMVARPELSDCQLGLPYPESGPCLSGPCRPSDCRDRLHVCRLICRLMWSYI